MLQSQPDTFQLYSRRHFAPAMLILVCITLFINASGQTSGSLHLSTGYAFNHNFMLAGNKVVGSQAMVLMGGAGVKFPFMSKLYFETGLAGEAIFASGKVGISRYNSRSFKLIVPLYAGINITSGLDVALGTIVKNNRDILDFSIRKSNNLRFELSLMGNYSLNKNWLLTCRLNHNIGTPKPFLTHDPRYAVMAGAAYRIFQKNKPKDTDQSTE